MAERTTIAAEPRTILGKRVKQLRRQGRLPANVFGRGLESTAIDVDAREFSRSVKQSGWRHMFELKINGEGTARYVIIRGVMRAGGTGDPIHIDFFQVDPNKPIQANVPVRIVGESPAVKDLAGTLVQSLDIVSIRSLPLAIPDGIEADAGIIKGFDVTLTVSDIEVPEGVEILTDPAVVVASVTPPRIRTDQQQQQAEE